MKEMLEVVALLVGFVSTIMAFTSLHHPYWKESTNYGSAITTAILQDECNCRGVCITLFLFHLKQFNTVGL